MITSFIEGLIAVSRMPALLLLVKATLLLSMVLVAWKVSGRVRASVRHGILAAAFVALAGLPFAMQWLPAIVMEFQREFVDVVPQYESSLPATPLPGREGSRTVPAAAAGAAASDVSSTVILLGIWMIGCAGILLRLLVELMKLRHLRRTGIPVHGTLRKQARALAVQSGLPECPELLAHESIAGPITFGITRPVVVVPASVVEQWTPEEWSHAMLHEFEHVIRRDWMTQLFGRIVCAAYWFHPMVWMVWRRFCLEAERACDDAVLDMRATGAVGSTTPASYAEQLVQLARRMSAARNPVTIGMANRSDLSLRIEAVLDGKRARGRAGVVPVLCIVLSAVVFTGVIAPVRAMAQSVTSRLNRVTEADRALLEAAEANDIAAIQELLARGANVNASLSGDGSPLIAAAGRGRMEAVRLLLDRGADPNLAVSGDGNPLIAAAQGGHVEVVQMLLDRDARVNEVVPGDENALIQAAGAGRVAVVRLLIQRRADVNARVFAEPAPWRPQGEWRTPLSMARKSKNREVIELLTAAGARE
jgi:beta-lactamase regulating signal transducer with metallopeptidase domain